MKKILSVMLGLLVMPAFAEVAPVGYWDDEAAVESPFIDESIEETEMQTPLVQTMAQPAAQPLSTGVSPRATTPRATTPRSAVRAVTPAQGAMATRTATPSRAVASRNASANIRSFNMTPEKTLATRQTSAPVPSNVNTARVGTLYTPAASNTGRVGVRSSAIGQLASARMGSAVSLAGSSTQSADTGPTMEEKAQLTDFCKAQYFACMDNYCDVLDDNQGPCSCSDNVKNFAKTEEALKKATEELQEVARKIQYLGLTTAQVQALFAGTEAEAAMANAQDTTMLKRDLDTIKKLVLDVKPGNSSFEGGLGFDFASLDLDFNNGFDLGALFGLGTNDIKNQRGGELYKSAQNQCKRSVLEPCKKQGVDITIISNGYDMRIDQACIVYERALEDSNTQMRRTVRNAQMVLERARLGVYESMNAYDVRGCVSALDQCMQSDFVCGADYINCLDPTGRFIYNGEFVAGAKPGDPDCVETPAGGSDANTANSCGTGLYAPWKSAWSNSKGLSEFIDKNIADFSNKTTNMVSFLVSKIGTRDKNGKESGMCMSVLNKCQSYTYNNKVYDPTNAVVREYLARTLVQIRAKQDLMVAEHVGNCRMEVQMCLITNGAIIGDYGLNAGYVPLSTQNACKAVAKSCASTIGFDKDPDTHMPLTGPTAETIMIQNMVSDVACYRVHDVLFPKISDTTRACPCPAGSTWVSSKKACQCVENSDWVEDTGQCGCTKDPTQPHMCGGPVLNAQGQVTGFEPYTCAMDQDHCP
ncbi:MAG: hypothetical protein FWF97_03955 [Alphaproteobacteria bacterium]|nr:hypothetical protein [Alphaproteobacteria bacterium]